MAFVFRKHVSTAIVIGIFLPHLILSALSIANSPEIKESAGGCIYETRRYDEGARVLTDEPCLRCHCLRNNLVCRLRVCLEVPNPPPIGCFIVQPHNECCPKLVCNSDMGYAVGSNSIIEARSGVGVTGNTKVNQHEKPMQKDSEEGCVHNGTVYAEGSAMDTSSLCEYCYCIKGQQHCIQPQCALELPNCRPVYSNHTCCPTKYNCNHEKLTTTSEATFSNTRECIVKGVHYREGDMIEGLSKQCENCFCVGGEVRCEPILCSIPAIDDQRCSPVYSAGHCCPISYKCISDGGDEMAETRHYSSIEVPSTDVVVGAATNRMAQSNKPTEQQRQIVEVNETTTESLLATQVSPSSNITGNNSTTPTTANVINTNTATATKVDDVTETTTTISDMYDGTTVLPTTNMEEEEMITVTEDNSVVENSTVTTDDANSTVTVTDETFAPPTTDEMVTTSNESLPIESSSSTPTPVSTSTESVFSGYNYTKPSGYVSPNIDAIINITHTQKQNAEDYDYDYNEPSLPPSLPNLRIIPFVAADAVVSKPDEVTSSVRTPMIQHHLAAKYPQRAQYPQQQVVVVHEVGSRPRPRPLNRPTTSSQSHPHPYYFKAPPPYKNSFSPPTETEGGFVPRDPILGDPFYDSKIDIQASYITTSYNVNMTVPPITEIPSITQPQQLINKRCVSGGRHYSHGQVIVSEPLACEVCSCFYGEVVCRQPDCSPVQPGCVRLQDHAHIPSHGCCGPIICGSSNELDSPTRVIDRIDHVTVVSPNAFQQSPTHLPAITVAGDLVPTPDPFRDVIRAEPAPDLPSLIGDIRIHMWEHTSPASSTKTLPSITTGSPEEVVVTVNSSSNLKTAVKIDDIRQSNVTNKIESTTGKLQNVITTSYSPVTKISIVKEIVSRGPTESIHTTKGQKTEEVENKNEDFSFGSVLDFLFNSESDVTTDITNFATSSEKSIILADKRNDILTNNTTQPAVIPTVTKLKTKETTIKIKQPSTNTRSDLIKQNISTVNNITAESTTPQGLEIIEKPTNGYTYEDNSLASKNTTISNSNYSTTPHLETNVIANSSSSLNQSNVDLNLGTTNGLLKLAGCNIYGRMYRVGRIISELSGPCLECMCTEIGVQCRPLSC